MKSREKSIKQDISIESTINKKTVKHITWEIISNSSPLFKKKCGKCKNSSLYYCSNNFRLNSQKKMIDVWLIYKCVKCDNTCNITILSRTRHELIDKNVYQKFINNDEETAQYYAFDLQTARRNNMELDHSHIEYSITHENTTLEDILKMEEDIIEFEIKSSFNFDLKLTSLIRQCFNISLNQLEKMLAADIINILPLCSIKKAKVKDGIVVSIHRHKLYSYLE